MIFAITNIHVECKKYPKRIRLISYSPVKEKNEKEKKENKV